MPIGSPVSSNGVAKFRNDKGSVRAQSRGCSRYLTIRSFHSVAEVVAECRGDGRQVSGVAFCRKINFVVENFH